MQALSTFSIHKNQRNVMICLMSHSRKQESNPVVWPLDIQSPSQPASSYFSLLPPPPPLQLNNLSPPTHFTLVCSCLPVNIFGVIFLNKVTTSLFINAHLKTQSLRIVMGQQRCPSQSFLTHIHGLFSPSGLVQVGFHPTVTTIMLFLQ